MAALAPDARGALAEQQKAVLDEGPSWSSRGRLAYITCSVLPSENRDQVDAFLARHAEFKLIPWPELWEKALPGVPGVPSADGSTETLQMTPLSHGTDGFFVAVLERRS
jgi:16S rRNA (cytosine967-C5)-methyltransferase